MKFEELTAIFNKGLWVRGKDQKLMGKGVFESSLVEQGFTKIELRKMRNSSILKMVKTQDETGAIRNTYVLVFGGFDDINNGEKTTPKQSQADAVQVQKKK